MSPSIVFLVALISGVAAALLTPWMRKLAGRNSAWFGSGTHIILASVGGAGAAMLAQSWSELVAFALLTLVCSVLVAIDLAVYRLPDIIIGPMYPVLFAALAVAAAVQGDWSRLGRAAAAMGILVLGYLVLALIAPSGLGLGDVKLSGLLGAFLGWLGWSELFYGTLAAFVLAGAFGGLLLLTRVVTRKSAIAFGPWMVAGAALGAALGPLTLAASA